MQVMKTAKIIPFPLARRVSMIERQARYVAELNPDAGDRHIKHQLKIQRDIMLRKGVAEEIIESELKAMDRAVRCALWRAVITPGVI